MFHDPRGRLARTIEEAEEYIFHFIAENHNCKETRVHDRSHDFDLYLPWLYEVVENLHVHEDDAPKVIDLDVLYMDAAWSLVMKGFMRPGPRGMCGDNPKDGYGKGYSLTGQGRRRLCGELLSESTMGGASAI
jgi:hypothetical protein